MKKITLLSLLLVLLLALAACEQQEEAPAEEVSQEAPAEEIPEEASVQTAAEDSADEASPAEAAADEGAETAPENPELEIELGYAIVDSVVVSQEGDTYVATVSGHLPDGCTTISGTSQSVEGSEITIVLETQRPVDMMCTQALTPYSEQIVIDTTGLAEGRYTVSANGVAANETVVSGEASPAPAEESADNAAQILNIVWEWTLTVDGNVEGMVPDPDNYSVTLHRDDRATIKADCNQVQVTYTLDGSSLVFNMLGPSTLAFCGEDSLDTQFLSQLGSVESWSMDGENLKLNTASGATMTFNNGGAAPGSIGIDPNQISLDTQGLPYSWQTVVVPTQPYDESMPPGPQGMPEHIEILFGVADPAERQPSDPVMFIIPVDSYVAMYEANENQSVATSMERIAELTYELPQLAPTSGYPGLPSAPYSPIIGANDLAVQLGRAAANEMSASKNGYRFVGRWAQDANPVTNQNLTYTYQGYTNDGQYLVSFFYPVRTDQLPDEPDFSQEQWDAFYADSAAHMNQAAEALNQLTTSDWQPDLATLDALVGSLQIEGMPASGMKETAWEWTAQLDAGEEAQTIDDPLRYNVLFAADESFSFQADCNSGGGTYSFDGGLNGSLALVGGPMTLAACPEESLADDFLNNLLSVNEFRVQPGGTILELFLPGGAGTMVFTAQGTADVELPDAEGSEGTGTITATAGANVRLGPSTGFPSLGVAPFGTSGTIIGASQDGQWWAFDVPESSSLMGWVLSSLVEAENTDDVPVLPAPVRPDPPPVPSPVPPSPTVSFWSDATTVAQGECTGLHWSVEGSDPAVFIYEYDADVSSGSVPNSGSMSICPTQTTTYEMRVQHADGRVEFRTVTITVQPSTSIENTSWVVSTLYGEFPLPGSSPTATFGSSNNFSANGGCNTFNGTYSISGSSISIGPLAGTQMSCGEALDQQEQAYATALQSARSFTIDGSQMTLFDGNGQELLRLIFNG